jgi:polygalacturonase
VYPARARAAGARSSAPAGVLLVYIVRVRGGPGPLWNMTAAASRLLALAVLSGSIVAAPGLRWPLQNAVGPPGSHVFDVTKFGARPDNHTDSSAAFAEALKAIAAANGGTLLVPAVAGSGVYLTLPLNLTTSRTRLRVESGATLKALCDNERWPKINQLPSYHSDWSQDWWFAPFIGASNVQDITLNGGGVIDASGECFWDQHAHLSQLQLQRQPTQQPPKMVGTRGNLLLFERVQRAELADLTFTNSPFWTLHLWDSEDLHVHGISVHNPARCDA